MLLAVDFFDNFADTSPGVLSSRVEPSKLHQLREDPAYTLRAGHVNMKCQVKIANIVEGSSGAVVQSSACLAGAGAAIGIHDRNRIDKPIIASALSAELHDTCTLCVSGSG